MRRAKIERSTKETTIKAAVDLDGTGAARVATGIGFLDHLLTLWAFHGGADWLVSPRESRRLVEVLRRAGGDVRYTEYEDLGHNSWDRAYADPKLWEWLAAQRLPDPR